MRKILLSVSVALLLTISCKSDPQKPKTNEEIMEKISKSKNINVGSQNYKVDVPTGWGTKDTLMNNVQFHFITAPTPDGDFSANINILNESMQGYSFDDYKKKTMETMKSYLPDLNVAESGDMDASDLKGSWFRYMMVQNGKKIDIINYTFPKDGVAYIITGAAKQGTMAKYRSIFDAVAKSFRFNN